MSLRLRQVALVARELKPVVSDLCAVFGIEVAYNDPGVAVFGLKNAVMPAGETFLEVVSPVQESTAAGRQLQRRGGDGGYMVILQADELDSHRRRLGTLGVRIAWETTLENAATIHLHPRDVGGAILSLDTMSPPESWRWAGPSWTSAVRTDTVASVVGVELQAGDPAAMARRWSEVLDRPLTGGGEPRLALDAGEIRFVATSDGRGDGLAGIDVLATDAERLRANARARGLDLVDGAVRVGGARFRLV